MVGINVPTVKIGKPGYELKDLDRQLCLKAFRATSWLITGFYSESVIKATFCGPTVVTDI